MLKHRHDKEFETLYVPEGRTWDESLSAQLRFFIPALIWAFTTLKKAILDTEDVIHNLEANNLAQKQLIAGLKRKGVEKGADTAPRMLESAASRVDNANHDIEANTTAQEQFISEQEEESAEKGAGITLQKPEPVASRLAVGTAQSVRRGKWWNEHVKGRKNIPSIGSDDRRGDEDAMSEDVQEPQASEEHMSAEHPGTRIKVGHVASREDEVDNWRDYLSPTIGAELDLASLDPSDTDEPYVGRLASSSLLSGDNNLSGTRAHLQ